MIKENAPDYPRLNDEAASNLLSNVFDACQMEPNTVPLTTLTSYSEYRRERYGLQKGLLLLVLVIFLALPLCFVSPKFTVTQISGDGQKFPVYEIVVDSRLPVSLVAASVEEESLVVMESGERRYTVSPRENGTLKIKVQTLNRQYAVQELEVSGIDKDSPVLTRNGIKDGKLWLYVDDGDGTGVDYENVYALTDTDQRILPLEAGDGCVVFPAPSESMNIFLPDRKGNTLQLVLTLAAEE